MRPNLRPPKPLTSVAILVVLAFLVLGAGPCDRTIVDTTYSVSGRLPAAFWVPAGWAVLVFDNSAPGRDSSSSIGLLQQQTQAKPQPS